MPRARKILIPDMPPKRRSARFQSLRNWLRLSLRPKPHSAPAQSPVTTTRSRPVQAKPMITQR